MEQEILTEEKKVQNFELFKKKLSSIGVDSNVLMEKYGERIKNGTYSPSNAESFICGDGTLLNSILRTLTPIALKLNGILPEEKRVDNISLIKICLLHQLAKSVMFIPNTNSWEVENRKLLYKYSDYSYALKMGMRSIAMCIECGIQLTENELEAVSNLDRDENKQTRYYSSVLATLLKQAMELTELINKK